MAKLSKRIRKGAKKAVTSQFVQDVLEKLVTAALLAAAAKLADSRAAGKVKRKAEKAIGVGARKTPSKSRKKGAKK